MRGIARTASGFITASRLCAVAGRASAVARNALWCGLLSTAMLMAGVSLSSPSETPGDAYRRGDFAKTIKLLKPQAESGGIDAQIMLGQMYLKGQGVAADPTRAVAWIRKAADQGSAIAAFDLGVFSSSGIGGPQDDQTAAVWYRKAAHQHYPDAAYDLAVFYHQGKGVTRSDTMALTWIDAGIRYLPAFGRGGLKSQFVALRDTLLSDMSAEQVAIASQLSSPDGPVSIARVRDQATLERRAGEEYPIGLRRLGWGGTVVLVLRVQADGTVGDSMIETSSGHTALDTIAKRLFASTLIEPERIDGEPIESWQLSKLTFHSQGDTGLSFQELNALPRR